MTQPGETFIEEANIIISSFIEHDIMQRVDAMEKIVIDKFISELGLGSGELQEKQPQDQEIELEEEQSTFKCQTCKDSENKRWSNEFGCLTCMVENIIDFGQMIPIKEFIQEATA